MFCYVRGGRYSLVGIATGYGFLLSGVRTSVGTRFFVPVQTGPGVHPASFTMGIGVSFPGVKRPGSGVNHPHPSSAEVKEGVGLCFCFHFGPLWPVIGGTLSFLRRSGQFKETVSSVGIEYVACRT